MGWVRGGMHTVRLIGHSQGKAGIADRFNRSLAEELLGRSLIEAGNTPVEYSRPSSLLLLLVLAGHLLLGHGRHLLPINEIDRVSRGVDCFRLYCVY